MHTDHEVTMPKIVGAIVENVSSSDYSKTRIRVSNLEDRSTSLHKSATSYDNWGVVLPSISPLVIAGSCDHAHSVIRIIGMVKVQVELFTPAGIFLHNTRYSLLGQKPRVVTFSD